LIIDGLLAPTIVMYNKIRSVSLHKLYEYYNYAFTSTYEHIKNLNCKDVKEKNGEKSLIFGGGEEEVKRHYVVARV